MRWAGNWLGGLGLVWVCEGWLGERWLLGDDEMGSGRVF